MSNKNAQKKHAQRQRKVDVMCEAAGKSLDNYNVAYKVLPAAIQIYLGIRYGSTYQEWFARIVL